MRPYGLLSRKENGIVLVSSLLLLLVVTIMSLAMFRSFGLQERIAGNMREKQRALQAANSAQLYAEWWLATQSPAPNAVGNQIASSATLACTTTADAAAVGGQICSNSLINSGVTVTNVPWNSPILGANLGIGYTPPGMNIYGSAVVNTFVNDAYTAQPGFYIFDMGLTPDGRGEVYQVDAYSYGLTQNTFAVVESTVLIKCIVCNPGGL